MISRDQKSKEKEVSGESSHAGPEAKKEQGLGEIRWYFRVAETGEIWEADRLEKIAAVIRSRPETPRVVRVSASDLKSWREEIERGPVAQHLRALQAPMGVKLTLVCWMEVS